MAMTAVRRAVAPVAQALATLKTGMPVCPICFWSCWPIPAAAAMRFPAARTPMSLMVTWASERAPRAASAARSTVSLSGCFPNLVMWIPRIQTSSLTCRSSLPAPRRSRLDRWASGRRLEAKPDGLGPLRVRPHGERGQPHLHPEFHVLGVRLDVDDVRPDARAPAVHDTGDERNRDPRRGERDDGEGLEHAFGREVDGAELRPATGRAGVAPVEEARPARRALLRHQVRLSVEDQVVDQRDLHARFLLVVGSRPRHRRRRAARIVGQAGRRRRTGDGEADRTDRSPAALGDLPGPRPGERVVPCPSRAPTGPRLAPSPSTCPSCPWATTSPSPCSSPSTSASASRPPPVPSSPPSSSPSARTWLCRWPPWESRSPSR